MSRAGVEAALAQARSGELGERCAGVERLAGLEGEEATAALASLLEESSWYLRERVVQAMGRRGGVTAAARRVLREGSWFARSSACDVLALRPDAEAADDLLAQVEDRNVSLQKSAVRALRRLAEEIGPGAIARRVAALPAERRRRVVARVGHQEPQWARRLEEALAALPETDFAPAEEVGERAGRGAAAAGGARALVRFRRWLAGTEPGGRAR